MAPRIGFRIQKHTAPSKARTGTRGRPRKSSESWWKKLVLLGYCGLKVPVILQILKGEGTSEVKDRRAQQILREALTDGKKRYPYPDRHTARKRAAFLRASISRRTVVHHTGRSSGASSCRETKDSARKVPIIDQWGTLQSQQGLHSTYNLNITHPWQSSDKQSLPDYGGLYPDDSSAGQTALDFQPSSISASSARTSIRGIKRLSELREILRRGSFSSSFVSDISSLLKTRFSRSSYTNSSRPSIAFSCTNTETTQVHNSASTPVKSLLAELRAKRVTANTALINECCSKNANCIHQEIQVHIHGWYGESVHDVIASLQEHFHEATSSNLLGNTVLFFAARTAATADAIISIAFNSLDINAVNVEGQTFLFVLDVAEFHNLHCNCHAMFSNVSQHQSSFECLMLALERLSFEFDHLDNNGRHFLSYLCGCPGFELDWLSDMMQRYSVWRDRVIRISTLRDSDGLFLADFLISNATYETLIPGSSLLDLPFLQDYAETDALSSALDIQPSHCRRLIHGEDNDGRTQMHVYLREGAFHTGTLGMLHSSLISGVSRHTIDVNTYDYAGNTPALDFLNNAMSEGRSDRYLCEKIEELVACGLNVNARSRDGTTILHVAAKNSLPELMEYLLSQQAQPHHRDVKGLDALDYVTRAIKRSTQAKVPTGDLGQALMAVSKLLDRKPG